MYCTVLYPTLIEISLSLVTDKPPDHARLIIFLNPYIMIGDSVQQRVQAVMGTLSQLSRSSPVITIITTIAVILHQQIPTKSRFAR